MRAGISIVELWRILTIDAPVAFNSREPEPGCRMWRSVQSIKSFHEADIASLIKKEDPVGGVFLQTFYLFEMFLVLEELCVLVERGA